MDQHFIPQAIRQELLVPNSVEPIHSVSGGLSGAKIWHCRTAHGDACLRAWPELHPSPQRLQQIHSAMRQARQSELDFVPEVYLGRSRQSFTVAGKILWELTQWMPGAADYLDKPSDPRLRAAMHALAQLHLIWSRQSMTTGTSPTVLQRAQLLRSWLEQADNLQTRSIQTIEFTHAMEYQLVQDTLHCLRRFGPNLLRKIQDLASSSVSLHFVLRDVWSDHVLFTDEQVTGVIDYGAAREDEPATDVARLLGSLEPFDAERWMLGLGFYRELNSGLDPLRVQTLDQVATLLSALQWMQWLCIERRSFHSPLEQLYHRWQRLLARMMMF